MNDSVLQSAETPRRSLRDRVRIDMYLTRLDWHLEVVLTGKEGLGTIRESSQTLASDPGHTSASLSDLVPPKALARRYADEDSRRPLWSIGVITAGLALLSCWSLFFAFTFGMLAAIDSTTPWTSKPSSSSLRSPPSPRPTRTVSDGQAPGLGSSFRPSSASAPSF